MLRGYPAAHSIFVKLTVPADAVAFLSSSAARCITGTSLTVDGGLNA